MRVLKKSNVLFKTFQPTNVLTVLTRQSKSNALHTSCRMESYEEKEARLVFLVAETAKQVEDAPKFVAIFEHDEDRSY